MNNKPNLNKIIADNLDKAKFQSKAKPSLPTSGWLDGYSKGGYISDRAKATQFGQYKKGGQGCPDGYINIDGECIKKNSWEYREMLNKGLVGTMEGDRFWGNKATLEPVTIVSSRDKNTQAFYDKLKKGNLDKYNASVNLGLKYGFPHVSLKEKAGAFDFLDPNAFNTEEENQEGYYRAHYSPIQQRMYLSANQSPRELRNKYISELAHHKQLMDKGSLDFNLRGLKGFGRVLANSIKNLELPIDAYDREYDTPGTLEYQAHQEIEPKLVDEYHDLLNKQLRESLYYESPGYFPHYKPTQTYKRGGGYFPEYHSWAPPRMNEGGEPCYDAQGNKIPCPNENKQYLPYRVNYTDPHTGKPTSKFYESAEDADYFLNNGALKIVGPQGVEGYYEKPPRKKEVQTSPEEQARLNKQKNVEDTTKSFLEKWYNSPMHREMLKNSLNRGLGLFLDKRADKMIQDRLKTIPDIKVNVAKMPEGTFDISDITTLGYVNKDNPSLININAFSTLDDAKGTGVHEGSHLADYAAGIPVKDVKRMRRATSAPTDEYGQYMIGDKSGTEPKARIYGGRYELEKAGIYNPFKEKLSRENFERGEREVPEFKRINDELRSIYSTDDIFNFYNTISKSNNTQPQTMAKYGSSVQSKEGLPKYQSIGEVTGKNCVGQCWKPTLSDKSGNSGGMFVGNTPISWKELLKYTDVDTKDKQFKKYLKDLQSKFPGLTQDQFLAARNDSFRIKGRIEDLPTWDKPENQTYDRAWYPFYRPLMQPNVRVTVPQILEFQSQQPGGLGGYQQVVESNYGKKKFINGGGNEENFVNFPTPYSNEFVDKYQKDYNTFYTPPRYYGHDDGYDAYFHSIQGKAPFNTMIQEDLGPTWEYRGTHMQTKNFPSDWQRRIDKGKATKEDFKYYPNYIQDQNIGDDQAAGLTRYLQSQSGKPSFSFYRNGGDISIPDLQESRWLIKYGPGGATTDGCPAGYYKHSLLGCIPIPGFQPVQKEQAQLKKSTPIAKGKGYGQKVDPYERIIAKDTAEKQAERYSDLAKRAGVSAALAAGVVTGGASLPYLAPALEAPLLGTLGAEYGTGAITAGNLLNTGFAVEGAKNIPNVAAAWKSAANKPTWGGVGNALGQTAITGLNILPFANTAVKGIPSVINDINKTRIPSKISEKFNDAAYTGADIHGINVEDLIPGRELGSRISKGGAHNKGVFELQRFPNYVVKFEDPQAVVRTSSNFNYPNYDFVQGTQAIEHPNIAKVHRQIGDLPGIVDDLGQSRQGQRALIMNKVTGEPIHHLTPMQIRKMPDQVIQDMYANLKKLRNNKLGFDFAGENLVYNPSTKQFGMYDIDPAFVPTPNQSIGTLDWNGSILGGGNLEMFGVEESGKNLKKALKEKLISGYRGAGSNFTINMKKTIPFGQNSRLDMLNAIRNKGAQQFEDRINSILAGMDHYRRGGMITDPKGQLAHPGQNTRIPGSNITMQGVPYPVLAKASNGMTTMMYPGQEYSFPGAKHVDEYPMTGWLNKYQGGGTSYTVQPGDNLSKIGRRFGLSPQQIGLANNIQNLNRINVNQVLSIPTLASQPDSQQEDESLTEETNLQSPTTVKDVQAPVTQQRVVNTTQETPKKLQTQKPKLATEEPASSVLGDAPPLFKSVEERDTWRKRLKEVANKALSQQGDIQYLVPLTGILDESGNPISLESGENCISGICGLNKAAGLEYNSPTYMGRYIGNQTFYDNVNNKKEDYYRVNGNFQVGDHVQLQNYKTNKDGSLVYSNKTNKPVLKVHHSYEIFDVDGVDDQGNRLIRLIHNGGGTEFREKVITEQELKNWISEQNPDESVERYSAIVNRPGYSLDKELLKKEREAATSPEARAALEKKKQLIEYQTGHDPNYQYSIREDSPLFKNQPEGMKKFIQYANNTEKINELVKKLGVPKDVIHDELLNTFGELGEENKWDNPWVGGNIVPKVVGNTLSKFLPQVPLESAIEKIGSFLNVGKGLSVGPGQIKMETLDDEEKRAKETGVKSLKELFGIKNMSDLQDFDKVIPLMTAMNIRNRQWMERKGTDLSKYLIGKPGAAASDLKYGVGRWTPYMYRGSLSVPTTNEETKILEEGSYADKVYHNIDENLQRILPYNLEDGVYRDLQPVVITASGKKKQKFGGQTNNWLSKYK